MLIFLVFPPNFFHSFIPAWLNTDTMSKQYYCIKCSKECRSSQPCRNVTPHTENLLKNSNITPHVAEKLRIHHYCLNQLMHSTEASEVRYIETQPIIPVITLTCTNIHYFMCFQLRLNPAAVSLIQFIPRIIKIILLQTFQPLVYHGKRLVNPQNSIE